MLTMSGSCMNIWARLIDTVLVNIAEVPQDYIDNQPNEEYLLQVRHDFEGMRKLGCRVIPITSI